MYTKSSIVINHYPLCSLIHQTNTLCTWLSNLGVFEDFLLIYILAVKCDFKAIPTVADASYTLHQSAEHSVALPGYVNVTYKCNDDYELVNPGNNTVICSLNRQQTGDGSSELVTADWSDVKDIKCQIGQLVLSK